MDRYTWYTFGSPWRCSWLNKHGDRQTSWIIAWRLQPWERGEPHLIYLTTRHEEIYALINDVMVYP